MNEKTFVIFGSVACGALDGDDQGGGRGRERTDPVGSDTWCGYFVLMASQTLLDRVG